MRPSADELSKLLLTLYAAPTQPELWPVFLRDFTTLLGLPAAAILHQDLARAHYSFGVAHGMDPTAQRLYAEHYGKSDPWRPRFLDKREGELAFGDALCSKRELHQTDFYGEYLSKYDVNLYCSVATVKQPESFELISIYRGLHSANPGPETLAIVHMILPHIRNALKLRYQMRDMKTEGTNFAVALDALTSGLVLLDDQGRCVHANRKAESIFAANRGLTLCNSRLKAGRSVDDAVLQSLIDRAITVARSKFAPANRTVSIGDASTPLRLMVITLAPGIRGLQLLPHRTAAAVVVIRDAGETSVTLPQFLISRYALTAAEAQLSVLLLQGHSLSQAAAARGVAMETCRSQLKSVFDKTNVRRQSELIKLLMNLTRNLDES